MKRNIFAKIGILCIWILLLFSTVRIATKTTFFSDDKNTIHLFMFPEQFKYEMLQSFEEETGIKVVVHYFATNEELIAKMTKTKGKGYDLVTPSDYAVKILRQKNLLKKIDKSQLDFFEHIDPFLLSLPHDPENHYSLPFDWEVFGFGMDKRFLTEKNTPPSWDLIFDEKAINYRIAMSNDPIEALCYASFYLYGSKKNLTPQELKNVKDLLIKQKQWIEAYTAIRGDYLLVSENCQVALSPSAFMLRAINQNPHIEFVLPEEGTFFSIESVSIPATSEKEALVYKFLNYVYKPDYLSEHTSNFLTFPCRLDALKDAKVPDAFRKALEETRKNKNIRPFEFIMPEYEARQTWVEIKSS